MNTLLLSMALLLPAAAPQVIDFEGDELMLPVGLGTSHVAVMVRINGSEPLLFNVDTHASIDACIDDDVAEALGLKTVGTIMSSDGVVTHEKRLVEIERLQCGGATFTNLRTQVDDYSFIHRPDGQKVSGLIGFTAFRELLVTFDYPESMLVLNRGNLNADDPHVIPYVSPSESPDIDLVLGDQTLRFGIDTGAESGWTLFKKDAPRLGLEGQLRVVGEARTVYRKWQVWGAQYPGEIGLAGNAMRDMRLSFREHVGRRPLGYGALRTFAVTYDQRRKLVSFVPGVD